MSEQEQSIADRLAAKYKKAETTRFDDVASTTAHKTQSRRVGKSPAGAAPDSLENLAKEYTELQLLWAEKAEKYGKLNLELSSLVGKKKYLSWSDAGAIAWYSVTQQQEKRRKVLIEAAGKHNGSISMLIDKIGEVLQERYQLAIDGRGKVQGIMNQTVTNMMRLDRKMIEGLRGSFKGEEHYARYEAAIAELEKDLAEVQGGLEELEKQAKLARAGQDLEGVIKATDQMSKLLDIKQGIMEGKLTRETEYADERRKVTDNIVAIDSTKENMAVARVHYQQLQYLMDTYNEHEIKFKHTIEDSLVSWKAGAQIAILNAQLMENTNLLSDVRDAGQRLLRLTSAMSEATAEKGFELLQTNMYDVDEVNQMATRLHDNYQDLLERKKEWAEAKQSIADLREPARYTRHE